MSEPRWRESQREKAQELERARLQALSILSFGLAHELRQPLQVIRSEAQNIRTRLKQLGVTDRDVDEAQESIDTHLTRIDENISFLASISTGNLKQEETVNLADVLRIQCGLFATRCAAAGITLTVEAPREHEATLNKTTVAMVLANLLANAFEAFDDAPQGRDRKITVSLSATSRQHVLRVCDTANGIPKELRGSLFKEFATGKTGGLGMGLYNCRLIVEAQGGEISFTTETGVGSQFVIRLAKQEGC